MLRFLLASLISLSLFAPAHAKQVTISGSTSVARIMDVLAESYNVNHKNTFVAVQSIGSTAGITLVNKGVSDIGMTSRFLTEHEQDETLTVFPIAYDGLAVVVSHSNPILNLSREQLFDIYKGKLTNWKQVGGDDRQIAVVTREASSGTRYSFESLLGLTRIINHRLVSDIHPDHLVVNSNSMMKTIVSQNAHAIGFISTGSVDRSIKSVKFEGVEAKNSNIGNGSYKLVRPFMVVYKNQHLTSEAKDFINFINSTEAKSLVGEYGYTAIEH